MIDNKDPAARERGRASTDMLNTDEPTSQKPKRKLGNVWREGRHLYRCGPNGTTVFDVWKWTGEPLQRGRA